VRACVCVCVPFLTSACAWYVWVFKGAQTCPASCFMSLALVLSSTASVARPLWCAFCGLCRTAAVASVASVAWSLWHGANLWEEKLFCWHIPYLGACPGRRCQEL